MPDILSQFQGAVSADLKAIGDAGNSLLSVEQKATASALRGDLGGALGSLSGGHAEAARAVAEAFAGPLVGSSIDSNGRIRGPLAQAFGSDPVTFALNSVKSQYARCVDLVNRVALNRLQKRSLVVTDVQGKKHTISLVVTKKTSVAEVALALAAEAITSPAAVADEAQRIMTGAGPGRGLDGFVGVRHLFGIDDAIVFGGIISVLIAIGPALIGALVALVSHAVPAVSDALAPKPPPPPPTIFGVDQNIALIGGGLALVVVLFVLMKKKPQGGA